MELCIEHGRKYPSFPDLPVTALLADENGTVVAYGGNTREKDHNPLGHAEMNVLQKAAQYRKSWNMEGCTLVVTLEPCPMCAGALIEAHVSNIVFGAWDPQMGACGSVWDLPRDPHKGFSPRVYGGVAEKKCTDLLSDFFQQLRTSDM